VSERLAALREMVREDPEDWTARYMLGRECLTAGLAPEAVEHLSLYVERFEGDKGAACGDLAHALEATGRRDDALAALARGIENARAHRHLMLVGQLEAERERLGGGAE
jgi:hypothetical protein